MKPLLLPPYNPGRGPHSAASLPPLLLLNQVSMPGMMDTVLNLGLNDTIVEGLARQRGERFAFDCYR